MKGEYAIDSYGDTHILYEVQRTRGDSMKQEHMIERNGKTFVLYAGLLDEAHSNGLRSIETELIQIPTAENGQVAIVHAVVRTEDGKFSGIGDASPENVGRNIVPHIIRMAECVPLGSEILTVDGWKTHDEVEIGDSVIGYDVEGDRLRWTPLIDKTYYEAAPVVSLKSKSMDVTCTPDHSWAVAAPRMTRPRLRKANEFKTSDSIIVSALAEGGSLRLGKRISAILGWIATDGSMREHFVKDRYGTWGPYYRADISQTKPEYVAEIRDLLGEDASEAEIEEYTRQMPSGQVSVCRKSYRWTLRSELVKEIVSATGWLSWRSLPRIVLSLDEESRASMLDAMLKADGSKVREGNTWVFSKKSKPGVMEAWEILALLQGRGLGRLQHNAHDMPARTMRSRRVVNTNYIRIEDEGAARVWCPTTKYGTWVMRQGSFIGITGNTRAKARAMRDAVNVGEAAVEELSDGDGQAPGTSARPRSVPSSGSGTQESRGGNQQNGEGAPATDKQRNFLTALIEDNGPLDEWEEAHKPVSELTRAEASQAIAALSGRD